MTSRNYEHSTSDNNAERRRPSAGAERGGFGLGGRAAVAVALGYFSVVVLTTGCAANVPAATVRLTVDSKCSLALDTGMGIVLDDGLILTAAHVVAGANSIELDTVDQATTATVVAFDPNNDLALLAPDAPLRHGWSRPRRAAPITMDRNTAASVYVDRDGRLTRLDVTIVRQVQITTEDIYIEADVIRPGWELRYPIEPGDSGAAVIVGGRVVGVVWARSRSAADRAYAIDPALGGGTIEQQVAAGRIDIDPSIDPDRC